ncbi:hypothetical protein TVAG_301300 [Trichomonas vaginalis G3]|uniref:Uncharacterized protein n=1 Tax=Trichomonas vaginalis (strain ATCC PRA-98 / G3) TaxID=412133 RepID=A2E5F2_TRIV3|nr:hypothetical protein TVAGG3_0069700 [Trichomonas vaginalis G3]EAY12113.1 hypothetical protein TVAG_301300 [Trichomonas vaginalis G3]KAI5542408.1 hypothetical protein TVAGG3_0069700 [Trichomonas vaginalis G3]|eukprot:XP_001324336.1 hypothetical protein [Trichomonas vaginalis G3]
MKRGRPTCHTIAKFISIVRGGEELYYELVKGKLVNEKKLQPHHTKSLTEKDKESESISFDIDEKASSPPEDVLFYPPEIFQGMPANYDLPVEDDLFTFNV